MIKLTAETGTMFIKRNVLHYVNANFIKIKATEKKRKKSPNFSLQQQEKE